jgi:hypothetical protein
VYCYLVLIVTIRDKHEGDIECTKVRLATIVSPAARNVGSLAAKTVQIMRNESTRRRLQTKHHNE